MIYFYNPYDHLIFMLSVFIGLSDYDLFLMNTLQLTSPLDRNKFYMYINEEKKDEILNL